MTRPVADPRRTIVPITAESLPTGTTTARQRVSAALPLLLSVLLCSACTPKDVVADVDGRRVTITDVRESMRLERADSPKAALDSVIQRELLAAAAVKKGLQNEEPIKARLKAAEREILAQALLDAEVPIPDEKALRARYDAPGMASVRQLELAHIFVAAAAGEDPEAVRKAQNKATTAWARLLGKEAFDSVAKDLSEDATTAQKGGVLGLVREGTIATELFTAAALLEADAVSKPIQTPYGFHVLRAITAVQTVKRPFDEVRGSLAVELREEARAALSKRLEQDIRVKTFEQAMNSLTAGGPR
jgi:peptidyl-prolyl cis-trans isomerase C